MERQIFREKSVQQLSSPEELNDYVRSAGPGVWTCRTACIRGSLRCRAWPPCLLSSTEAESWERTSSAPIIPLASLVGGALLILGDRARRAAEFIEQANGVTQLLMELMGALLPLFIFLVVSRMFWTGSLGALARAWRAVLNTGMGGLGSAMAQRR